MFKFYFFRIINRTLKPFGLAIVRLDRLKQFEIMIEAYKKPAPPI